MMFRFIPQLFIFVITFFTLSVSCAEELIQGLSYRKIITPLWHSIHVLEVDPTYLNITAAHAKDSALGIETVQNIAKRHRAIAAINGGFFKMGEQTEGLPAGILKIKGRWYGIAYRSRGAIGWSNQTNSVFMDRIQTKTKLKIQNQKFPIYAVNQPSVPNRAILYTDTFGNYLTSNPNNLDIIIKNNQVVDILPGGKTKIPTNGYVYSIGPRAKTSRHAIRVGDKVKIEIDVIPQLKKNKKNHWQIVDNIIGGTPLLIEEGRTIQTYTLEFLNSRFIKNRHARTAVGLLNNGHWVFVVVEQSPLTGSPGMTIAELTKFMHKLDCQYALNLDGGGSSTLYIDNSVMNHPELDPEVNVSGSPFRQISDAILILRK